MECTLLDVTSSGGILHDPGEVAGHPGGHARVVVAHVVLPTPAAHTRQHPPAVLSSII